MIQMHQYNCPDRTVQGAGDICGEVALNTIVIQKSAYFHSTNLKVSHAQAVRDHLHDLDPIKITVTNLVNVDGQYEITVIQEPETETPEFLERQEDQQPTIQLQIYALVNY